MFTKPTEQQLDDFVRNHVIYCQSSLVQELFEREVFSLDDILNFYQPNPDMFEQRLSEHKANPINEATGEKYTDEELESFAREECEQNDEMEACEIYEWWIVDQWLEEQLEKQGECILKTDYQNYWGRQCTGQAIALDSVIEKIYTDNNL